MYVVISIILITVMLATKLFYPTLLHSFIGYYFEYLPLSPLQVYGVSLTGFKEFKAFWPSSFTTPTVKGIDNFWEVQGINERFNDSHRQIASGAVKTANESMGDIRFRTTPKDNLRRYSYILGRWIH